MFLVTQNRRWLGDGKGESNLRHDSPSLMEEEDIRQGQGGHELRSSCRDTGQQSCCEHTSVGFGTRRPNVAHGEQGKADDVHRSPTVLDRHGSPDELANADGQGRPREEVRHFADVADEIRVAGRCEEVGRHGHGTHRRSRAAGVAHGYTQARKGEDVVLLAEWPARWRASV